jgi:hypothetical protein
MGRLKKASRPAFKARKGAQANQPAIEEEPTKMKKSFGLTL